MNFHPFEDIRDKVISGERLNFEEGLGLYQSNDLPVLGALAQIVRRRLNSNRVFYSVNLHLNYTNICVLHCCFCSFARCLGDPDAFVLSPEEIQKKVRHAIGEWRINEVHVVGGHHPDLGLDYFLDIIRRIRETDSSVYLKAFSAPEIAHMAGQENMPPMEILRVLKDAGLNGLPGGGAEIFSPEVRRRICPDKITGEEWLEIHRQAHRLGLQSNAAMLYGHIEKDEDRVDHVLRLRELQDDTRGFYSFIPLPYRAEHNPMESIGETGGYLDLKVYAVSRLLLDNIPHIKAYWVTTGLKMAQVALSFGVDDLGGTNLNEKIMHDAGSDSPVNLRRDELERVIRTAGYIPQLVDSSYQFAS